MTAPRQILPGRTYMVTRRCTQRQFLLVPDEVTKQIFEYCLAVSAARYRIDPIAWIAMSNHYHAVFHDHDGTLPAFLAYFNRLVAATVNERWQRCENMWSTDPCSVVHLVEERDVADSVTYVLGNAVEAELVERADDWTGASSVSMRPEDVTLVHRPPYFFRENGKMPRVAELRAVVPPGWSTRPREWQALVRAALRRRERAARKSRRSKGRAVARRPGAGAVSPHRRGGSYEPKRKLRPVLACKARGRRFEEVASLRRFAIAYACAMVRFQCGDRAVVFPMGTYQLRQFSARDAPAPGRPSGAAPASSPEVGVEHVARDLVGLSPP